MECDNAEMGEAGIMGMYTELFLRCGLNTKKITPEVDAVLNYLFNGTEELPELPKHKFFACERWRFIGKCSSHYHIPFALSKYVKDDKIGVAHIISRSDLKNYDGEIEQFIDWLKPYLEPHRFYGWYYYEEDELPTLITPEWLERNGERLA